MTDLTKYIKQLIMDIHESIQSIPEEPDEESMSEEESFRKHIEAVEEYIYGDPKKISLITAIARNNLPLPEQLDQEQKTLLAQELENLLHHFHFVPDFPEGFPDDLKYKFLRNIWDDKHPYVKSGGSHIEFCNYDPDHCPFPDYCNTCAEFSADYENPEKEKSYITSIFNYCDRWCERCEFTDRCRNYDTVNELIEKTGSQDDMKKFQEDLAGQTDAVSETVSSTESKNLTCEPGELKGMRFKEREDEIPIVAEAQNYSFKAHDWLMKHNNYLESMEIKWETEGLLETNREALTVVRYYCLFISAKIRRAASGLIDMDDFDEDYWEGCKYDMNGSAKIGLIAMDRSMESWKKLYGVLPDFHSDISMFLQILNDLRENAEKQFPEARNFIRPGLDE